jgi:hypothetical protein
MKACGLSGAPILEGTETAADIPKDFNPDDYPLDYCEECIECLRHRTPKMRNADE